MTIAITIVAAVAGFCGLASATVLAEPSAAAYASATTPGPVTATLNVVYGRSPGGAKLTEDVYRPKDARSEAPMVILVHGGAFVTGDKSALSPYAQGLASTGYVVVNLDYTLAPPGGRGYPEQVTEVRQALAWNHVHAARFGADPNRIGIVGFSSGGYLAAMAGVQANHAPRRPVRAVVTLSAPLDLQPIKQLARERILKCGYRQSCRAMPHAPPLSALGELFGFLGCPNGTCSTRFLKAASPSEHVTRDAPAFLLLNSSDELIPASQARAMATALSAHDVASTVHIVPGALHGAAYLPVAVNRISAFLHGTLGAGSLQFAPGAGLTTLPTSSPNPLTLALSAGFALIGLSAAAIAIALWRRRGEQTTASTPETSPSTGPADRPQHS